MIRVVLVLLSIVFNRQHIMLDRTGKSMRRLLMSRHRHWDPDMNTSDWRLHIQHSPMCIDSEPRLPLEDTGCLCGDPLWFGVWITVFLALQREAYPKTSGHLVSSRCLFQGTDAYPHPCPLWTDHQFCHELSRWGSWCVLSKPKKSHGMILMLGINTSSKSLYCTALLVET